MSKPGLGWSSNPSRGKDWDTLKRMVIARDGMCVRCGTDQDLTADHITAKANGGLDVLDNLQAMCRSCNGKKGAAVEIRANYVNKDWLSNEQIAKYLTKGNE